MNWTVQPHDEQNFHLLHYIQPKRDLYDSLLHNTTTCIGTGDILRTYMHPGINANTVQVRPFIEEETLFWEGRASKILTSEGNIEQHCFLLNYIGISIKRLN